MKRDGSEVDDKKTVVIVGSGAVGLLYGCRLLEAEIGATRSKTETHFICRRDFSHCSVHGIRLKSPDGDFYSGKEANLLKRIHRNSSSIPVPSMGVDWIICAVKSYSLQDSEDSLRSLISPMVGPNTRFLMVMNGLGCQQYFCEWFGKRKVFVGMAFTCVNRNDPNKGHSNDFVADDSFVLVNHIAFGALHIGHSDDDTDELEVASALWAATKIADKVIVAQSLRHAQWSKLCWNIPFSGLCVALGGVTTDIIANDPDLRFLADKIMIDTISLANEDMRLRHCEVLALLAPDRVAPVLSVLDSEKVRAYCWGLTDRVGPYKPSTLLDLISGADLELEYIFRLPLERAREISELRRSRTDGSDAVTGVEIMTDWPHLETVVRQVCAIARIAVDKRGKGEKWVPVSVLALDQNTP
jgi:2-dehydropantoate 2-reductase